MVILRATQRVLRQLPPPRCGAEESETALGDWYVNRLVVARQPLLLLVSSRSLLALVTPARDIRTLPDRLPGLVADRLHRLQIPTALVQAEVAAMDPVVTAPTRDRSVLGILLDFARSIPYYLPAGGGEETALQGVEAWLAGTPCHASRRADAVVFPDKAAPKLLAGRWLPSRDSALK
jgi:hypothetical protein